VELYYIEIFVPLLVLSPTWAAEVDEFIANQ